MPRLIWSPSAVHDVQRIYRFLAEKNMDAAQRVVKAIRSGVQIIAQHPEVGRPADEMDPEYREWMIGFGNSGYVVLYRYDGEDAVIVAVRHQKEAGY
jgi:plasmid stabilization system protein ParE